MSRLLIYGKTPCGVLELDKELLVKAIGSDCYRKLKQVIKTEYRKKLFDRLSTLEICAITRFSDDYPAMLEEIYDPPYVLYTKGNLSLIQDKAVAIVGSRAATRYGMKASRMISSQLAKQDVCIVSGMARGADAAAHYGALDAGGKTIAVLGCGLDICYPPENQELMNRIIQTGVIVSEYLPGSAPVSAHFPQRNRIIAGLSHACILVEGAKRSGAMITVNYAIEAGKEVFAIPGPIDSPMSESPNQLIYDGAHLTSCANDVLEPMGWALSTQTSQQKRMPSVELSEEEKQIVVLLTGAELTFDELEQSTNMSLQTLNSLLTMLTLRGIIKQQPGGIYTTR